MTNLEEAISKIENFLEDRRGVNFEDIELWSAKKVEDGGFEMIYKAGEYQLILECNDEAEPTGFTKKGSEEADKSFWK